LSGIKPRPSAVYGFFGAALRTFTLRATESRGFSTSDRVRCAGRRATECAVIGLRGRCSEPLRRL
jgi:hypothetical protein